MSVPGLRSVASVNLRKNRVGLWMQIALAVAALNVAQLLAIAVAPAFSFTTMPSANPVPVTETVRVPVPLGTLGSFAGNTEVTVTVGAPIVMPTFTTTVLLAPLT